MELSQIPAALQSRLRLSVIAALLSESLLAQAEEEKPET